MEKENIGESLKKFFKEKGLTKEQVAERLAVTQGYKTQLFNGKAAFGKGSAKRWEEMFGLSQSWLLKGKGYMLKEATGE